MDMKQKRNLKNTKFTLIAWVMAVLVLVAAIPVNLLFDKLDFRFDMSSNELYTLTSTTTDYLDKINDKHITIYCLVDMDDLKADPSMMALSSTLEQYDSYDCIDLVTFYPNEHPEIIKELDPEGYYLSDNGDLFVKCEETGMVKWIEGQTTYTFELDEAGNVMNAIFNGENYITGAIKTVVDGEEPMVYFLTGHGEKSLSEYTQFQANLSAHNYRAAELNLLNADEVPDDAKIIIIAAPQKDITDAEKEKLDEYLDDGGNISFLMSPNEQKVKYANIERILLDYCLGMDYNRIYETDKNMHVDDDPYTIMANLQAAPEEEGYVDMTSGLMQENSGLYTYMPESRSFYTIYGSNYTSLTIDTLMSTNTTAVGEVYGGTDEDPDEIVGTEMILAAYSTDKSRNNSKVVVMGNAEFIDDSHVETSYVIVPTYLFLSTITWMYDNQVDMNIPDKNKTYDYLTINSEGAANRTLAAMVIVPVAVAAIGVFIWWRRKNG